MNFRADWEPSVLWWTLAVLAVQGGLLALIGWRVWHSSFRWYHGVGAAAVLALVVLSMAWAPRYYLLDGNTVAIQKYFGRVVIPVSEITEARTCERAEAFGAGTIRIMASGGPYGYFGAFSNGTLGDFTAYVTDRRSTILLRTKEGCTVISPVEREQFLKKLAELQGQESKGNSNAP